MKNTVAHRMAIAAAGMLDRNFLLTKADATPSVRSTFTLTPKVVKILDALSEKANISPREVFDLALKGSWLNEIVGSVREKKIPDKRSVKKTLVLSKRALEQMEKVLEDEKNTGVKRDDLACAVITSVCDSYNAQVKEACRLAEVITDEAEKAIFAVDTTPAEEYIKESKRIPEKYREIMLEWIKRLTSSAINAYATNIRNDYEYLRPEVVDEIFSLADNLDPIELKEEEG